MFVFIIVIDNIVVVSVLFCHCY